MALKIPKFPGGNKPPGGSTAPAGPGLPTSSVNVSQSVSQIQEADLTTAPGIVPYTFYSLTNASGQMLRPGVAAAISVDLPFRGSIVALVAVASAADSGTYTVYIDGVASAALVTLSASTGEIEIFEQSEHEVAEQQSIDVRASGVSSANPIEVTVYVSVDPSTIL